MKVLELIFYILGLIPILYEFEKLSDPKHMIKLIKDAKQARKDKRKLELSSSDNITIFMSFFFWIWITVGLFSFQWPAFVFLYITSILLTILPKKTWILVVDSIISITVVIGIMINSRVRIDLVEQIIILTL